MSWRACSTATASAVWGGGEEGVNGGGESGNVLGICEISGGCVVIERMQGGSYNDVKW